MGREYGRVHRLLRLIHLVHGRPGTTVGELAETLEQSERNVYRDIQTINAAGIPCVFDDALGGYRVRREFLMPPVQLTFEEAMSLTVLAEHVARDGQVPYLAAARQAIEKVRSGLPTELRDELAPIEEHVRVDLARGTGDDDARRIYDAVRRAIRTRRALRCRYEPARSSRDDGDAEFTFEPYALWYAQRAWFAVGRHSGRPGLRQLKLGRFASAEATERPYEIPADFDLDAHLGRAWRMIRGDGTVHAVAVRFEPGFAEPASETLWHPSQQSEWDDAGRVTLRFEVEGLDEIVWWILGYGPGATVLEPPALVTRTRELLTQTLAHYAGAATA